MADYEFYPVGVSSEGAREAIVAASDVAKTAGILRGDGNGHVAMAEAGVDFGYPVLLGNGPPTQFVVGEIGQFYYNRAASSAPYMYVCVDYTQQGYQWQVLGTSGDGFTILGYYNTLELMQSSVTNPAAGDAYGIGTAAPYTIYVFDGLTHTWKNNGTLGVGGVTNGIPPHGTTGQALLKRSDASGDLEWGTPVANIPDGSITSAKLAGGSVTADKLAGGSVTADKLAAGAVSTNYTAAISAEAWTGEAAPYTAAVTVTGMLATDTPIIDLVPSDSFATAEAEIEAWGMVYRAVTAVDTVTFYATDKPTVALNVQIKAVRK